MPATEPAGREAYSRGKNCADCLLCGQLSAARVGDPVLAGVDALDEPALGQLRELLIRPVARNIEVVGDDRGRLDGQNLSLSQPFQNAILRFSHPIGPVPERHNYAPLHKIACSLLCLVYWAAISLNVLANTTKWMASRHGCNDRPGALGAKSSGRGRSPRPGGRHPTMSTNDPAGNESRHDAIEQIGIDARDVLAGHYDTIRLEAGE